MLEVPIDVAVVAESEVTAMKGMVKNRCIVALVAMLVALIPAQPIAAQGGEIAANAAAEIDAYLHQLVDSNAFSGSVLIARGDEILLSQGYGLANREWGIPNTPQTKFRIMRLTEQFTAMAILMLQERGLLSVNDPICQYLEGCREDWQDITIHHLLTHTSGLPFAPFAPGFDYLMGRRQYAIDLTMQLPLQFAPGEGDLWSDAGYWLLGEIIATVSGQSYIAFLKANIFEPLGMTGTDYDDPNKIVPQRADGYTDGFRRKTAITNMQVLYSAGGLHSTVEDLFTWAQALFSGQVVSANTWNTMLANAVPMLEGEYDQHGYFSLDSDLPHYYIYGMTSGFHDQRPVITYFGLSDWPEHIFSGYRSGLIRFTDDDLTIIILSNYENTGIYTLVDVFVNFLYGDA
jgi:CubicO group peptidase (beta-lactamase class C family)